MNFFITFLLALPASLGSAAFLDLYKRDPPLKVSLEAIADSQVKVSMTNTGSIGCNLFNKGTFLDGAPVEKLKVYSADNSKVPFEGILLRMSMANLEWDAFTALAPGQIVTVVLDAAELHDLSAGGDFAVSVEGAIPYASIGSTILSGSSVPFKSNTITLHISEAHAAPTKKSIKSFTKRTVLSSDCTGAKRTALITALTNCKSQATAAANAAATGNANKFQEFFKSNSSTTRDSVAARFQAIAADCGSLTSGPTQTHCVDTYNACTPGVLAYTIPSQNYVVYCDLFFNNLTAQTRNCHGQDQATTVIHEETHAPGVYPPGTVDNAYGYNASMQLTPSQAQNNADTYSLFANAIYAGC